VEKPCHERARAKGQRQPNHEPEREEYRAPINQRKAAQHDPGGNFQSKHSQFSPSEKRDGSISPPPCRQWQVARFAGNPPPSASPSQFRVRPPTREAQRAMQSRTATTDKQNRAAAAQASVRARWRFQLCRRRRIWGSRIRPSAPSQARRRGIFALADTQHRGHARTHRRPICAPCRPRLPNCAHFRPTPSICMSLVKKLNSSASKRDVDQFTRRGGFGRSVT
jgi:hypothetical protein